MLNFLYGTGDQGHPANSSRQGARLPQMRGEDAVFMYRGGRAGFRASRLRMHEMPEHAEFCHPDVGRLNWRSPSFRGANALRTRPVHSSNGTVACPTEQSMTSKIISRLSISDSRSAACCFQSGVSRTRNGARDGPFRAHHRQPRPPVLPRTSW